MKQNTLRLYLVTDSDMVGENNLCKVVSEAVSGGVSIVQLREKNMCTRDFVNLARKLKLTLSGTGVPLIINDRIDVALACDADGVHLGQSDMPCDIARQLLGPDKIIGLSIENLEQMGAANTTYADYLAASPVFATSTKTDTSKPWGLDGLKRFTKLSSKPCVAIGGINEGNAAEVISCGVDGVAVVSAIMQATSPAKAAEALLKAMKLKQ